MCNDEMKGNFLLQLKARGISLLHVNNKASPSLSFYFFLILSLNIFISQPGSLCINQIN
jgi:hypothetical protein